MTQLSTSAHKSKILLTRTAKFLGYSTFTSLATASRNDFVLILVDVKVHNSTRNSCILVSPESKPSACHESGTFLDADTRVSVDSEIYLPDCKWRTRELADNLTLGSGWVESVSEISLSGSPLFLYSCRCTQNWWSYVCTCVCTPYGRKIESRAKDKYGTFSQAAGCSSSHWSRIHLAFIVVGVVTWEHGLY